MWKEGDLLDQESELHERGSLDRTTFLRRAAALAASASAASAGAFFPTTKALAGTFGADSSSRLEVWAWQPRPGQFPAVFDAAGKRWMARHKGGRYHYTIVDYPSYFTKFKTRVAGGDPPDVMEMAWAGQYHDLVQAKALTQLDSLLPQLPKFGRVIVDSLRVGGKLYAVPLDVNTLTIGYNTEIFAKLNLRPPSTLAELNALAKPIRAAGYEPLALPVKDGWPAGDVWFAMVAYTDPTDKAIRQAETGAVKWTDTRFLRAAQGAQSLVKSNVLAAGAGSLSTPDAIALFASGKAAMFYPIGVFDIAFVDAASGGKIKYGFFPFPPLHAGPKPRATGGVGVIWSVPAKAKNVQGAFDYIRLTNDPTGQKKLISQNLIPAALNANISVNHNSNYQALATFQGRAATRALFNPQVYTALLNSMTGLLSGNGSPKDVVNELVSAARK